MAEQKYSAAMKYKDAPEKAILSEKAWHYQKATALFNANDFAGASEEFALAEDYQDAKEKVALSDNADHFQKAEALYTEKNYQSALDEYNASNGYKNASDRIKECSYYLGIEKLNSSSYDDAITLLKAADGYENSAAKLTEAYYKKGKELFVKKNFSAASEYLKNAGNFEYAKSLYNASKGEECLNDDLFDSAILYYNNVQSDCKIDGFDVQSRKKTVLGLSKWANISGEWKATKNYIEVKNVWNSNSSDWDSWYIDDLESFQYLKIKCKLNDDNTVTVTGSVSFYAFNDYSSISKYCKAKKTSRNFTWDNVTSIPSSTNLGDYATLNYSNGVFSLVYKETDYYSAHFHNIYYSSVTYGAKN